jgi:hypothetical protein
MQDAESRPPLRELVTDALRHWELRRIPYNLLLAAIVGIHFLNAWPASLHGISFKGVLGMFLLAVLANVSRSRAC